MNIVKPQSPLMLGDIGILPLTNFDQIIMPDGDRWDGTAGGITEALMSDPRENNMENPEISAVPINADLLGGINASEYATKTQVSEIVTEALNNIRLASEVSF